VEVRVGRGVEMGGGSVLKRDVVGVRIINVGVLVLQAARRDKRRPKNTLRPFNPLPRLERIKNFDSFSKVRSALFTNRIIDLCCSERSNFINPAIQCTRKVNGGKAAGKGTPDLYTNVGEEAVGLGFHW
jgi:hypothetical protein